MAGAVLFALCACAHVPGVTPDNVTPIAATPTPIPDVTPAPTPVAAADTPEPPAATPTVIWRYFPVRVEFVGYDVVSDIYPVGVTDDAETIDTLNSADDSAWFHYFAAPLEEGNCILNGHNRWKSKEGAFSVLKRMAVGDEIRVTVEDGRIVCYSVTEIVEHTVDEFPMELLGNRVGTRLTLITCKGDYDQKIATSRTRVVAIAERTEVIVPEGHVEMGILEWIKPEQLLVPDDVLNAAGAQPTP